MDTQCNNLMVFHCIPDVALQVQIDYSILAFLAALHVNGPYDNHFHWYKRSYLSSSPPLRFCIS